MELTWLGWIFVIDLAFTAGFHILGGIAGIQQTRDATERMLVGFFAVLYLIGFFTIGFVK